MGSIVYDIELYVLVAIAMLLGFIVGVVLSWLSIKIEERGNKSANDIPEKQKERKK